MSGATAETRVRKRLSSQEVDRRIVAAAIGVFAATGWSGFTFEAIGNASGAGKGSIYRRYRSREELMLTIIDQNLFDGSGIDAGDVEQDLRLLCAGYAEWLDGPGGRLSLRFFLEDRLNDDFRALWSTTARPAAATQALFAIIDRGKARGELAKTSATGVILHTLLGGVVQQLAASALPSGTVFASDEGRDYLDQLVASVLRAHRNERAAD